MTVYRPTDGRDEAALPQAEATTAHLSVYEQGRQALKERHIPDFVRLNREWMHQLEPLLLSLEMHVERLTRSLTP